MVAFTDEKEVRMIEELTVDAEMLLGTWKILNYRL